VRGSINRFRDRNSPQIYRDLCPFSNRVHRDKDVDHLTGSTRSDNYDLLPLVICCLLMLTGMQDLTIEFLLQHPNWYISRTAKPEE
jgi:hypothetical protein